MELKEAYKLSIAKWEHILEIVHDIDDIIDLEDWCGETCGFCEHARTLNIKNPCDVCECPEGACYNSRGRGYHIIGEIQGEFLYYNLACENDEIDIKTLDEIELNLRDQIELHTIKLLDLLKENYEVFK